MNTRKITSFLYIALATLTTCVANTQPIEPSKKISAQIEVSNNQAQESGFTVENFLHSYNISAQDARNIINGVKAAAGLSICFMPSIKIIRAATGLAIAGSGVYGLHQDNFDFKRAAQKSLATSKEMAEKALPKIHEAYDNLTAWAKEAWNKPVDKGQEKK